jgi:hypothetical protein
MFSEMHGRNTNNQEDDASFGVRKAAVCRVTEPTCNRTPTPLSSLHHQQAKTVVEGKHTAITAYKHGLYLSYTGNYTYIVQKGDKKAEKHQLNIAMFSEMHVNRKEDKQSGGGAGSGIRKAGCVPTD